MTEKMKPLYVRLSQAKDTFGIHRATFYRWAAAGRIRIYKKGPISLLKVSEIEVFLEGRAELSQNNAT